MSEILLTYYSATLRQADISLVTPGNWLNDQLILFYFEYLAHQHPSPDCLLIDPCTSFIILIEEDFEDLNESLNQLDFSNKKLIIFPINNHLDRSSHGGSHWTLLVIDIQIGSAYYYDSLNGSGQNRENALNIMQKFSMFLRIRMPNLVNIHVRSPQNNSCDCGVYVLMIAEQVYGRLDVELREQDRINPAGAKRLRKEMKKIIDRLVKN